MFDMHVHAAPDVVARRFDDGALADRYESAGFSGFVLKAHRESTVGRAYSAGRGRRLQVYGGVVLNSSVGGINPLAVAAALDAGGRVIWLPTEDAGNHLAAGLPRYHPNRHSVPTEEYRLPTGPDEAAARLQMVLSLIAEHDAVLATGHVSAAEMGWTIEEARRRGVGRIVLTHPSYKVPNLTATATAALADLGAYVEITAFQLLGQPRSEIMRVAAFIRDVGVERVILSSDVGQPGSPAPEEALAELIAVLSSEGLDRGSLVEAASGRPESLVKP